MSEKHEIIRLMAADLNIRQYDREPYDNYIARVIYSALSMWTRFATLDEDIFVEPSDQLGASKRYILSSSKPFMENMIELYPATKDWFFPGELNGDQIDVAITTVRDRLYSGGELVAVGFDTGLALPEYEECNIDEEYRVIRGVSAKGFQIATGLAQIRKFDIDACGIYGKWDSICDFYGLKDKAAHEFLHEYMRFAKWGERGGSYEVFNKYSNSTFSNCWKTDYVLKEGDISVYRKDFFDFGLIVKQGDSTFISEIDKHLIEGKEVRRFMYALKYDAKNPVKAKYRRDNGSRLVELNLYNALPQKEEDILMLLGWPMKDIDDKYNLLFHESVWLFIESVLGNLNIMLEEGI